MSRFFSRSIRNMLVGVTAIGALLTQAPAQAADGTLWQSVQKAGVYVVGRPLLRLMSCGMPARGSTQASS
jgi:hypothetical protein